MNKKLHLTIIGAGLSGLSCALVAARGLLDVAVLNAESNEHKDFETHNFITNDGESKQSIFQKGLSDLKKYPNLEYHNDPVVKITLTLEGYLVSTESGNTFETENLVFAMGNNFDFNATKIDGLRETWGISAFSCPYCHGYEWQGKLISIIAQTESDVNFIKLVSRWTSNINIFIHADNPLQVEKAILQNVASPTIYKEKIKTLEHDDGQLTNIILENGERIPSDAVFLSDVDTKPNDIINSIYNTSAFNPQLNKDLYKTDPFGRTDLRNVFIIGDSRTRFSTLVGAANEGFLAGVMIVNDYVS